MGTGLAPHGGARPKRQALFRAYRRSELLGGGGKRATGGQCRACGEAKLMGGPEWRRLGDVRVFHWTLAGCIILLRTQL